MMPETSAESTSTTGTNRRRFMQTTAGFFAAFVTPAAPAAPATVGAMRRRRPLFHMYRWSGHGRRVSRAALSHAANRRYLTMGAAKRDLPHRGSHLKLVPLDVTLSEIFRLFISRRRLVADLRHLR